MGSPGESGTVHMNRLHAPAVGAVVLTVGAVLLAACTGTVDSDAPAPSLTSPAKGPGSGFAADPSLEGGLAPVGPFLNAPALAGELPHDIASVAQLWVSASHDHLRLAGPDRAEQFLWMPARTRPTQNSPLSVRKGDPLSASRDITCPPTGRLSCPLTIGFPICGPYQLWDAASSRPVLVARNGASLSLLYSCAISGAAEA
jgi:hypothetical protein